MKSFKNTWIVIANSADACIYHIEEDRDRMVECASREIPNDNSVKFKFHLAQELTHQKSLLKGKEIGSDKPGNYKNGLPGRSSAMQHADLHRTEQEHFAKELSHFLKKAFDERRYQKIILCSEPRFYGVLKKSLPKEIVHQIKHVVHKDYIPLNKDKLKSILEAICQHDL